MLEESERGQYHADYYAAYIIGPDGHNVEAVYHGPMTASAESIVVTPAG